MVAFMVAFMVAIFDADGAYRLELLLIVGLQK
jgi:hypothetical protein